MARQCAYRYDNGDRCKADAAEDSSYCTTHKNQYESTLGDIRKMEVFSKNFPIKDK